MSMIANSPILAAVGLLMAATLIALAGTLILAKVADWVMSAFDVDEDDWSLD
jgi:hypothetical protein